VTGLIVLVPVALGLGMLGLMSFFWAMRHEQFEDLDGAAQRVLLDEDED
jgi:cbb3-type cytochrome oxidase maturation protein